MGSALLQGSFSPNPSMRQETLPNPLPLETGAPAFPVPPCLEEAVREQGAADEWTEYPPLEGLPALRESMAAFHRGLWGGSHGPENILVTYGAMQAVFNICDCELETGDEVLLPAPFWFQFPQILGYMGVNPEIIQTKAHTKFKLTPELLDAHISSRTRMLILTNPNNPTGTVYTPEEWKSLVEVLAGYPNLLILLDEAYNLLSLKHSPGVRGPGGVDCLANLGDRVLSANSLSKNFGLAGLRIGYIAASPERIERLAQRQRFATLGVNLRLQQAALRVLEARETIVPALINRLLERRKHAFTLMKKLPLLQFIPPDAGYYFFVNIKPYLGFLTPENMVIRDDRDLADFLLHHTGVSVLPSSMCGMTGYCRLTFALPEDIFEEGIRAMVAGLHQLRPGI